MRGLSLGFPHYAIFSNHAHLESKSDWWLRGRGFFQTAVKFPTTPEVQAGYQSTSRAASQLH